MSAGAKRGTCGECRRQRRLVAFEECNPDGRRRWICGPCRDDLTEATVRAYVEVDRGWRAWREAA